MKFPAQFLWGAASAAYQVEGASTADGKGENIWDAYSREQGHIMHHENGNVACDHYHRFREDVKMMRDMGIKNYRLSISWSRILPDGTGAVNEKGLQFYSDLVDELLANGIEPLVTLFHWDYPLPLHHKGGWLNRESVDWFAEYTEVVVKALSNRVQYWMTINEPQVFIGNGYDNGSFAPFLQHPRAEVAQMCHHVLLAHGTAVSVIRKYAKKKPIIGFAFVTPANTPKSQSPEDIEEACRKTFTFQPNAITFNNAWWTDPIFLGDYPKDAYEILGDDMPQILPGDLECIAQPVDFYGVNIYQSKATPQQYSYSENAFLGCPRTQMEWPITPEVLYWAPKFLYERYGVPIMITENGMACHDWVYLDGKVHDPCRIDFMKRYLRELHHAITDGVPVIGYMYWSIMDNFEWASGYDKRFGLVYVDYQTQQRTVKDSGAFYKKVIETNGAAIFSDTLD